MDTQSQDSAPAALGDLIAAGLVSHEIIGDPARLPGEGATLRALCNRISGPVYRIEAFHYAVRAGASDLGGRLGEMPEADWAAALQEALSETLGAGAVWVTATDLLPEAGAAFEPPLLVLRAQDEAVSAMLAAAEPDLQAVINARFATEVARLVVEGAIGIGSGDGTGSAGGAEDVAARLAAIEARQGEVLARLGARAEAEITLARLSETLAMVVQRLDAQADVLHAHIAREDRVAGRLAELSELAGTPAAFQETLGVTLAEFLAQLERRHEEDAAAPARVPQVS